MSSCYFDRMNSCIFDAAFSKLKIPKMFNLNRTRAQFQTTLLKRFPLFEVYFFPESFTVLGNENYEWHVLKYSSDSNSLWKSVNFPKQIVEIKCFGKDAKLQYFVF